MASSLKRSIRDVTGATMIEYALLLALISVICMVAVKAVGGSLSRAFSTTASVIAPATPQDGTGGWGNAGGNGRGNGRDNAGGNAVANGVGNG